MHKLVLLLLCGTTAACASPGWHGPRLQLGFTGQSGTSYAASYDGKTLGLDVRLPRGYAK